MKRVEFIELIDQTAIFCGIDEFKFRLGDLTLEAIEDEKDGYRSSLDYLEVVENIPVRFQEKVTIVETKIGIALKGKYGVILEIGTDIHSDSCYPSFIFRYTVENLTDNIDISKLINQVTL